MAGLLKFMATCALAATAVVLVEPLPHGAVAATRSPVPAVTGIWRQKSQLVWNHGTGEMERRLLQVWDNQNRADQEFSWDADTAGGHVDNGPINGSGLLVWRERGAPAYDKAAIVSIYRGVLLNGRPHGDGVLTTRKGLVYAGRWRNGEMHGHGDLHYANGDHYAGEFSYGLSHGDGRLAQAGGEIYEGRFRDGERHGTGRLTTPGGGVHQTEWTSGVEHHLSAARRGADLPDDAGSVPDNYGLAAAGDINLNKLALSVVVDREVSQKQQMRHGGMTYVHLHEGGSTRIIPNQPQLLKRWKGDGTLSYSSVYNFAPAYLKFVVRNRTGGKIAVRSAYLEVVDSRTDLQPLLGLDSHWGCVGYRPTFNFTNHGWGPAEDARVEFSFVRSFQDEAPEQHSYALNLGTFKGGRDVSIESALKAAGVDVPKLKAARYKCPSAEQLPGCRTDVIRKLQFGQLQQKVEESGFYLRTNLVGRLSYTWRDSEGETHERSSAIKTPIQLTAIELPSYAECGGAEDELPPVANVPLVRFSLDKKNYRIEVPLRGGWTLRRRSEFTVAARAYRSSLHRFRLVIVLKDGSTKTSPPIEMDFYRPVVKPFKTSVKTPACYIVESSC